MARATTEPGRLSIIAGRGALPVMVYEAARGAGWAVQYLSFIDRPELEGADVRRIETGKPLDIVMGIRGFKATHICMAGGVDLSDRSREGFVKLAVGGRKKRSSSGDTGLSKLGGALEFATGAKLLGAHEIVPDLLAEEGLVAGPKPARGVLADGRFALATAISAGELDLGQAVVCSGRRVVATEDIAGTDALIRRVGDFRSRGLIGDGAATLVLAKAKKPNQPMFVDLPAIGPDTVDAAYASGIAAIFVEADKSIVVDRAQLIARAQACSVTVYAGTPDG